MAKPKQTGTKKYTHKPVVKTTINKALAKHDKNYTSTGDSRVDLFFKSARGLGQEELQALLEASWETNPLDTLKLIFQLRDCRGGKGEKELFRLALLWLQEKSPSTVEKNFKLVPHFGSWKDVTNLIGTSLEGKALESLSEQLKKDVADMKANPKATISLAAKWAPTENHQADTAAKAAKKLALILAANASTAKKDYRKNYLTPLRKHLKIIETLQSAGQWNEINFNAVPSRCMKLQRKAFERHEPTLFAEYLESLKKGEAKVNAKQLFPHEIVKEYFNHSVAEDTILEEQWKVLENQVRESGSLADSIVLSDVSGSMSGTPMEVSIALGILISGVTAHPFKDIVISFSENPQFCLVKGDTLRERVHTLSRIDWGGSTNFNKVFTMILEKAKENNLPASAMPKKLFVISDMCFDQAGNMSNHDAMIKQYKDAGYEVPTMIYWNVNGSTSSIPVGDSTTKGVALVSGFSPSILKAIIATGDTSSISPAMLMEAAINDKRYADLQV
ncbi:hypothetical protein CYY_003295 [Polysphondylium violaceum]|uniref:DUF2828 family protein n=1 Tax=Polysphondylium violaceum TaxID=133409 RepID=A0A8J4Q708_9MYCE|nr:hypothetical protein CYY_003295 [Polysphondylium violaceum]